MSQKLKINIKRALSGVFAAICSCGGVADLIDNNRTFIQKVTIQQYNIR